MGAFSANFAAQLKTVFPKEFCRLLDDFGIDREKEADVHEFGSAGSLKICGGWFYLTGELVEAGERLTDVAAGFQYFFRGARILCFSGGDFGENVLAPEFYARVPWVIAEEL